MRRTHFSLARWRRPAFTLLELLVVIGIIAVLTAILLPAIAAVRRDANALRCVANVHQLALAMTTYASAFKNKFPPNISAPAPGQWWYDGARIGGVIPAPPSNVIPDPGSTVWVCPEDDGARRSYSMCFWASSKVDAASIPSPKQGDFFSADTKGASRLVLLIESWSYLGNPVAGLNAQATVGCWGTAAQRFGAAGGNPFSAGRWETVNCELSYSRHRRKNAPGYKNEARGRIVVAFADTHVELLPNNAIVDYFTGTLTGICYWSPYDVQVQR